MIELIFVIVIIGIMAAIFIPKLALNREDAKSSIVVQELAVCIMDVSTHYLMWGVFDDGLTTVACSKTTNENACFTVDGNNSTGILNVKNNVNSSMCIKAQTIAEKNGLSSAVGVSHNF